MRPPKILAVIRAYARARRAPFTWRDLCPPLEHVQARNNLENLYLAGELVRVQKGKPGWQSNPSVYAHPAK